MRQLHHSSSSNSIEHQRDCRRVPVAEPESNERTAKSFRLHPMADVGRSYRKSVDQDDLSDGGHACQERLVTQLSSQSRQKSQVRSIAQKSYVFRLVSDIERLMAVIYRQDVCVSTIKPQAIEIFREGDIVLRAMQIKTPMFECTKHRDPGCNCYLIDIADRDLSKKLANLRKMLLDAAKKIEVPNLPRERAKLKDHSASRSRSANRTPPRLAYSSNRGQESKLQENHFNVFKTRKVMNCKENVHPRSQMPPGSRIHKVPEHKAAKVSTRSNNMRPALAPYNQTATMNKFAIDSVSQYSPVKCIKKKVVLSPANVTEKVRISPGRVVQNERRIPPQNNAEDSSIKWAKTSKRHPSRERESMNNSTPSTSPKRQPIQEDYHQPQLQISDSKPMNQTQQSIVYADRQPDRGRSSFRGDNILSHRQNDTVFDMADDQGQIQTSLASKYRTVSMPTDSDVVITAVKIVDDRLVVAGYNDGSIVVFSVIDDFKPICAYHEHDGPITLISTAYVSLDGSAMPRTVLMTAAVEDSNTLAVWDCDGFDICKKLGGHESTVTSAKDLMNDYNIVTAAADGKLAFWNLNGSAEFVNCVECSTSPVFCLEFDQDSSTLFSGSQDGLISVWSITINSPKDIFVTLKSHISSNTPVLDMALWTLSNNSVVALGGDYKLRLLTAKESSVSEIFKSDHPISDFFMVDQSPSQSAAKPQEPMVFGVTNSSAVVHLPRRHQCDAIVCHDFDNQTVKMRCAPHSQLLVVQGSLVMLRIDQSRPSFSLWRVDV